MWCVCVCVVYVCGVVGDMCVACVWEGVRMSGICVSQGITEATVTINLQ